MVKLCYRKIVLSLPKSIFLFCKGRFFTYTANLLIILNSVSDIRNIRLLLMKKTFPVSFPIWTKPMVYRIPKI